MMSQSLNPDPVHVPDPSEPQPKAVKTRTATGGIVKVYPPQRFNTVGPEAVKK